MRSRTNYVKSVLVKGDLNKFPDTHEIIFG